MKRTTSMTKIQQLDFTNWENILSFLGGFLSYFFGFYEEYKNAVNSYTCISTAATSGKALLIKSIGKINDSIGGVTTNCQPKDPIGQVLTFVGNVFSSDEDKFEKMAKDLNGIKICTDSAYALFTTIKGIFNDFSKLLSDFQTCMQGTPSGSSNKYTDAMIKAAEKTAKLLLTAATGGAGAVLDVAGIIIIIIKFGLICLKDFSNMLDKYRVLGKYVAQMVKLISGVRRVRRRMMYKMLKYRMKKYKN
jgi:hypothetical protein